MLAEAFPKVIAVIVAHGGRNVIDFIARVGEQMFGFFHPKFRDVLVERSARLRFKVGADVGGGQIDAGADIFYRKRGIAVMLGDIIAYQTDHGVVWPGV